MNNSNSTTVLAVTVANNFGESEIVVMPIADTSDASKIAARKAIWAIADIAKRYDYVAWERVLTDYFGGAILA